MQVTIGEMKSQGVRVASRCLWDTDSDNYASYSFKNVSVCMPVDNHARELPAALPLTPAASPTTGVTVVCSYGIRVLHRVGRTL